MTELTKNLYRTVKSLDERKTRRKETRSRQRAQNVCSIHWGILHFAIFLRHTNGLKPIRSK